MCTCISVFSQIGLVDQSMQGRYITYLLAKNRKLHKFATTSSNLKKLIISDMHHCKTYIYVNFQQNRAHKFICKKS